MSVIDSSWFETSMRYHTRKSVRGYKILRLFGSEFGLTKTDTTEVPWCGEMIKSYERYIGKEYTHKNLVR